MIERHDRNIPKENANVTRGIEHHKYIDDKRTAEILNSRGFGYLAGAFDQNHQNK